MTRILPAKVNPICGRPTKTRVTVPSGGCACSNCIFQTAESLSREHVPWTIYRAHLGRFLHFHEPSEIVDRSASYSTPELCGILVDERCLGEAD
jgi:hypothetical protein